MTGRRRLARPARRALLALVVWPLAACGIVFDAPDVSVLVGDNRIVYADANDEQQLVGGETVLHIANDSSHERQVVLARLDAATVPAELRAAESPREDERILGMTHVMQPKEAQFAAGGLGYKIDTSSFHLYLAPGQRYVLFDRLRGVDEGVVLEIVPGERA